MTRSLTLFLILTSTSLATSAQTAASPNAAKSEMTQQQAYEAAGTANAQRKAACEAGPTTIRFFSLANASERTEASDILATLRNTLCPNDRVYLVGTQNVIVIDANAEELARAQRIVSELDHPRKSYRLTYTINELDNGKLIGSQHYSLVAVTGQLTTLKQGSKVPVVTGASSGDGAHAANTGMQTQFQYLDVGMNFTVTLDELTNGVRLRSKVEESSVGEDKYIAEVKEPVIRQAVIEGTAFLTPGKSVTLGSIDITGTTRRLDIDVVMDPIR